MDTGRQREERRYLVRTGDGDVVVVVNPVAGGLDDDLFELRNPDAENLAGITMTTPLTAFSAKAVDIIELHGTDSFAGSRQLREMLVREKATALLRSIERFAKRAG
ncbi:MAG TPA: hypothetical protein VF164_11220 [Trueperaceae bacterium]